MTNSVVARRYAEALFSLGNRQGSGAREQYGDILGEFSGLLELEPRLGQILKSPVVGVDEKKGVVGQILERLGAAPTVRNFFFLLADKNRLGAVRDIASVYRELLDNANGIRRGTVTTAIKLSDSRQDALRKALQEKAGGEMQLVFRVDPEILGGMVLTVGDKVLDSSLRAQLGILRGLLTRGM